MENSLLELDAWLLQKGVGALFKYIIMKMIINQFSFSQKITSLTIPRVRPVTSEQKLESD